jgi:mono/diheme cytochrome c family protein
MVCHSRAANYVLGLTEVQMNKDHDYGGGVIDNQLRTLECLGMLKVNYEAGGKPALMQRAAVADSNLLSKNPDQYKKLADPYDDQAPLEARVRSYLQSNCAHCHVDAGGGNAQFNAEHTASLADMKLIDVAPVHHKFDLPDAKLVAPGHPERSVLLYRLSHRGRGQMPQLATNMVDEKMVKAMEEWIRGLQSRSPAVK